MQKFIISLQKKNIRDREKLFVIEGDKLIKEFLSAKASINILAARPEFIALLPSDLTGSVNEIVNVSYEELKHISTLKTPKNALAVIPIPHKKIDTTEIFKGLSLVLDCIQDPGNLGTIIRAAAWFGISDIVCSHDCVDVYNPKVIQASMGAILHVNVYYSNLEEFILSAKRVKVPIFGAMLEGASIYEHKLDNKGVIILGNESKGISEELYPLITDTIMIPGINKAMPGIESLNVGMATSVILSEFARRNYQ